MDPGRFDPLTAYAAVNTLRLDDMNPHIYRTHDGGKTWQEIVTGIPGGAPVSVGTRGSEAEGAALRRFGNAGLRVVRRRRPLAIAAAEYGGFIGARSRDQRRRSRRRHARARHLDPRRHHAAAADRRRHSRPATRRDSVRATGGVRVRWNTNTDTPLPPDEPAAPNPPEGAIIDYYLKSAATGPVTWRSSASDGKLGAEILERGPGVHAGSGERPMPLYWYRPLQRCRRPRGCIAFTWDVHYQPLDGGGRSADRRFRSRRSASTPCRADDAVGKSRPIHGEADGEREDLVAADGRKGGSAREDAGAGDAAGVHALEIAVLRRARRSSHGTGGAGTP